MQFCFPLQYPNPKHAFSATDPQETDLYWGEVGEYAGEVGLLKRAGTIVREGKKEQQANKQQLPATFARLLDSE